MIHAPLAPSSAPRTVACHGSVALAALHPEEETQDTREGDATHWALAELVNRRDIDVGLVAANNVTLNTEMVDAAEMVGSYLSARDAGASLVRSETLVANASVHVLNWGTPDYMAYRPGHLFIDDFKYGHGYIGAFENWQLINYVILTLWEMRGAEWWKSDIKVTMTIHQPRNYHRDGPHRVWTAHASELLPYRNTLATAYEAAMQPEALCTPNPHCDNCPGRIDCEANAMAADSAVVMSAKSIPLGISPDAAGRELRRLRRAKDVLDSRVSGLEQQIDSTISRGGRVIGWLKEPGSGKTVWNKPLTEVIMLGDMLGLDFSKPGAITPLQAVAALKKSKIDPKVIEQYSETTAGGSKLIETASSTAAKAFSK